MINHWRASAPSDVGQFHLVVHRREHGTTDDPRLRHSIALAGNRACHLVPSSDYRTCKFKSSPGLDRLINYGTRRLNDP